MDDLPGETPLPEPANLRFLRRLVTVLTAVMILGMITVVTLMVLRFNRSSPDIPALPPEIALPEGASALGISQGPGWFAVTTDQNQILIFSQSGALRQTVDVVPGGDGAGE